MSAVFTQGSRRLAAIPAGKVPNMDGSEMIDLQRFNVQRSAFKLPRLLLRTAIKEQRLQTVIMTQCIHDNGWERPIVHEQSECTASTDQDRPSLGRPFWRETSLHEESEPDAADGGRGHDDVDSGVDALDGEA
jgi:hypothetical protein